MVERQRDLDQPHAAELFRLLAENLEGHAFFALDPRGLVQSWNAGAERLLGYRQDDIVGQPYERFFTSEDRQADLPRRALQAGLAADSGFADCWQVRHDGSQFWASCKLTPLRDASGSVVGVAMIVRNLTERKQAAEAAEEYVRLAAFIRDVSVALIQANTLPEMLRQCAAAMVKHLHGAFSRIWILNAADNVLELKASAGLYTHLDGPHSRVPVGQFKIGLIAQERLPHLTNAVVGDPRVGDQRWAQEQQMIAFAGYPLIINDNVIGVMAMFARQPLTEAALEAMASVANEIALGITRKTTEEERRSQQEWFSVTLASIGDAVIATDTQGNVTFLNHVAQELTGWTSNEARGQPLQSVFNILHEETLKPVESPVAKVLQEGRVVGLGNHTVLVSKQGAINPIDDSAAPIRDANGQLIGVVLVFRNVTEQRSAEHQLRLSDARKSAILNTAIDCIITMNHLGEIVEFNPAAERTFGYRQSEVIGQELATFIIPPFLREQHRLGLAHYLATGEGPVLNKRLELTAQGANGKEFPVELAISRISNEGPPLFTAYLRDISEQKRVERHRNTRVAVTQALSGAATVDAGLGEVLRVVCENLGWNAGFFWSLKEGDDRLTCEVTWRRPDFLASEPLRGLVSKNERLPGRAWAAGQPAWLQNSADDEPTASSELASVESPYSALACPITLEGRTLGVIEFLTPRLEQFDAELLEAAGSVAGHLAYFIERKTSEEQLRRSERELAEFFDNATVALHWVGADGTILRVNRAELEMLGYRREEYVGRKIAEFHADQPVINDILRRLQCGEQLSECPARLRRKDGVVLDVLIDSSAFFQDNVFVHTRCFTRDVTDRKLSEGILLGQKRVLELLVQNAPLQNVLDALCEVMEGQSQHSLTAAVMLVDEDGRRLRSLAGPRVPASYSQAVDGLLIGPTQGSCGAATHLRKEVIVADISTDVLWKDFRDLALGHGFRACWSTPLLSSQGVVLGTFAVYSPAARRPTPEELRLVDILTRTAGVAVERRKAEDALRNADRRKDEFLATLAHELRNPLAPIRNGLEVMRLCEGDREAVIETSAMMERQLNQMVRLVDDLLDVSRITRNKLDLRTQSVDLSNIIQSAVETSRPLIEKGRHSLTIKLPAEPLLLQADSVRLAQVFSNLLNNSAKYTESGGQIKLSVEREGNQAVVCVRDNGMGIPKDALPHIFEMFSQVDRSLERSQGGLGIGLTLVRRLVELHGGTIHAHSEGVSLGSEFVVRLPLAADNALQLQPAADQQTKIVAGPRVETPANSARAAKRRILVVDDNRDSATSMGMMLRIVGNETLVAHDGLAAVQAAADFRPNIILLDIGLPLLNGYDVCRQIRQQPWSAGMYIVALTGWGQDEDRRRSAEAGFDRHLVKPVEISALEELLAAAP